MTDWCPYAEMVSGSTEYNERALFIAVLVVVVIFLQYRQRYMIERAREDRHAYIRALRMQETSMRREREALKRERMAWDSDYKVMCERNRRR